MSIRDLIKHNPPLREECERTAAEEVVKSMLPGDGEPEDHIVETLVPSKGTNAREMEEARRGHRLAEEQPERGAYHHGVPPTPDNGGETQGYTPSLGQTEGMGTFRDLTDRVNRGIKKE